MTSTVLSLVFVILIRKINFGLLQLKRIPDGGRVSFLVDLLLDMRLKRRIFLKLGRCDVERSSTMKSDVCFYSPGAWSPLTGQEKRSLTVLSENGDKPDNRTWREDRLLR